MAEKLVVPRWVSEEEECIWCRQMMKPTTSFVKNENVHVSYKCENKKCTYIKRFKDEKEARKSIEEFIRRQKENFITAEGRLIGVEALQARQIHKFEGVSEQFSGKYFLTSVTHTMSLSEGYSTSFSARKMINDIVVQPSPKIPLTEIGRKLKGLAGL